ncbi:unnamed protein product [Pedinophyceae sp. YPF-701]|nr:unnamed protein product [Pedinophyceae sp. YPF-701]
MEDAAGRRAVKSASTMKRSAREKPPLRATASVRPRPVTASSAARRTTSGPTDVLDAIQKLEAESQDRAAALAAIQTRLKHTQDENTRLASENAGLRELVGAENDARVSKWLESNQGLSDVRAAGVADARDGRRGSVADEGEDGGGGGGGGSADRERRTFRDVPEEQRELEMEVDRLKHMVEISRNEANELRSTQDDIEKRWRKRLSHEIERMRRVHAVTENVLEKERAEAREVAQQLADARQEISGLRDRVAHTADARDLRRAEQQVVQYSLALELQRKANSKDVKDAQALIDAEKELVAQLRQEANDARADIVSLRDALEAAQVTLASKDNELKAKDREILEQQAVIRVREQQAAQIRAIQAEVESLRSSGVIDVPSQPLLQLPPVGEASSDNAFAAADHASYIVTGGSIVSQSSRGEVSQSGSAPPPANRSTVKFEGPAPGAAASVLTGVSEEPRPSGDAPGSDAGGSAHDPPGGPQRRGRSKTARRARLGRSAAPADQSPAPDAPQPAGGSGSPGSDLRRMSTGRTRRSKSRDRGSNLWRGRSGAAALSRQDVKDSEEYKKLRKDYVAATKEINKLQEAVAKLRGELAEAYHVDETPEEQRARIQESLRSKSIWAEEELAVTKLELKVVAARILQAEQLAWHSRGVKVAVEQQLEETHAELQGVRTELSERVAELTGVRGERNELEEQLTEARGVIAEHEGTIADLRTTLVDVRAAAEAAAEHAAAELAEARRTARLETAELRDTVQAHEARIAELEGTLETVEGDLLQETEFLSDLAANALMDLTLEQVERDVVDETLTDAQAQALQRQGRIEALEAALEDVTGERDRLRAECEGLKEARAAEQAELRARIAAVEEAKAESDAVGARLQREVDAGISRQEVLMHELEAAKRQCVQTLDMVKAREEELDATVKRMQRTQKRALELGKKMEQAEQEMIDLRGQLEVLRSLLDAEKTKVREANDRLKNQRKKLLEETARADLSENAFASLQKRLQGLQERSIERVQEAQLYKEREERAMKEVAALEERLDECEAELRRSQERVAALESAGDAEESQRLVVALTRKCHELERSVDAKEKKIRGLLFFAHEKDVKIDDLVDRNGDLEVRLESVENQLAKYVGFELGGHGSLVRELVGMRAKVSELEARCAERVKLAERLQRQLAESRKLQRRAEEQRYHTEAEFATLKSKVAEMGLVDEVDRELQKAKREGEAKRAQMMSRIKQVIDDAKDRGGVPTERERRKDRIIQELTRQLRLADDAVKEQHNQSHIAVLQMSDDLTRAKQEVGRLRNIIYRLGTAPQPVPDPEESQVLRGTTVPPSSKVAARVRSATVRASPGSGLRSAGGSPPQVRPGPGTAPAGASRPVPTRAVSMPAQPSAGVPARASSPGAMAWDWGGFQPVEVGAAGGAQGFPAEAWPSRPGSQMTDRGPASGRESPVFGNPSTRPGSAVSGISTTLYSHRPAGRPSGGAPAHRSAKGARPISACGPHRAAGAGGAAHVAAGGGRRRGAERGAHGADAAEIVGAAPAQRGAGDAVSGRVVPGGSGAAGSAGVAAQRRAPAARGGGVRGARRAGQRAVDDGSGEGGGCAEGARAGRRRGGTVAGHPAGGAERGGRERGCSERGWARVARPRERRGAPHGGGAGAREEGVGRWRRRRGRAGRRG